ncbi:MAG: MarR family transcriptional regulator [Dehalococcoidales bacterium]
MVEKSETIKKITGLQRELAKSMRQHAFKHWMALSMSTSQVKTLFCIIENESISSKKLADILEVTPANVTGIIDRLIEQGLVLRAESLQDRRVVFLEATEMGKQLIENLEQYVSEQSFKMLSGMSEDELDHLYLGLSAFLKVTRSKLPNDKTPGKDY